MPGTAAAARHMTEVPVGMHRDMFEYGYTIHTHNASTCTHTPYETHARTDTHAACMSDIDTYTHTRARAHAQINAYSQACRLGLGFTIDASNYLIVQCVA